jgi:hypothetical protein
MTNGISPKIARDKLQKMANKLEKWTNETGFTISTEKTVTMLLSRKNQTSKIQPFKMEIKMRGDIIKKVKTHKILGLTFDWRLKWDSHLKEAKKRGCND